MKTTKKDFERFKDEFHRWQKLLGLMDWRTCFEQSKVEDAYAEIFANPEGRIATVIFADECSAGGLIGYDPLNTGRHEALELLLAPLKKLASEWAPDGVVDEATHAVIRRLENLLDEMEKS